MDIHQRAAIRGYLNELASGKDTSTVSAANPFEHRFWVSIFSTHADIAIDGDVTLAELEVIVEWLKERAQ